MKMNGTPWGALALGLIVTLSAQVASGQEAVLIRADYREGMRLDYDWAIEAGTEWTPEFQGQTWGVMFTEFEFRLKAKALYDDKCVFEVLGQSLQCEAEGPKGKLGIDADRDSVKLLLGQRWTKPGPRTPLKNEMTLTMGPRFNPTASTGLGALAIYFLPQVSHKFWFGLTTAPIQAVKPGMKWGDTFDFQVPGARGKPLKVDLTWRVLRRDRYKNREVMVIEATAEAALHDSNVIMNNGDRIHIKDGKYTIRGEAKWDIEHGVLMFAEAGQELNVQVSRPVERRLEHKALSTLELRKAAY